MKILYVLILIFGFYWVSSFQLLGQRTNTVADQRIKSALDLATHDASLQLDISELDVGIIKFVQDDVISSFKQTLERNLYLNSDLSPANPSGNILTVAPSILYLKGVDTGSFPQDVNTTIEGVPLIRLNNPSIIAVLEYTLPYKTISGVKKVKVVSIHQYKPY